VAASLLSPHGGFRSETVVAYCIIIAPEAKRLNVYNSYILLCAVTDIPQRKSARSSVTANSHLTAAAVAACCWPQAMALFLCRNIYMVLSQFASPRPQVLRCPWVRTLITGADRALYNIFSASFVLTPQLGSRDLGGLWAL
jgi:hypothetical protein